MGALEDSTKHKSFMSAFSHAQRGTGIRAVLGRLKFLHRDETWWEACKQITDYADSRVDEALERLNRRKHQRPSSSAHEHEGIRLVDEMARDTQDRLTLRSHIISVFSPAHDGAATVLTNAVFHLARHPQVWEKLRKEIEPTKDNALDYELLNGYTYLGWVLKES